MGIGAYEPNDKIDTVGEEVHGVCTDQGSNMVVGFKDFEGGACACHRLSNALKAAFAKESVQGLIKKVSHRACSCTLLMLLVVDFFRDATTNNFYV